jgi:hypothetical protein
MLLARDCYKKYGEPSADNPWMMLWDLPPELEVGVIPNKLYCNKDIIVPLANAITLLKSRGLISELKTWDGCFNIRKIRGGTNMSLHSWGIAIDVNAFENPLGKTPKLSSGFVKCFTDAGFDWGGHWRRRPDGMHFQLSKI